MKHSLDRRKEVMERAIKDYERLKKQYEFGMLQLRTAKANGKDGYDDGRYMKNQRPRWYNTNESEH